MLANPDDVEMSMYDFSCACNSRSKSSHTSRNPRGAVDAYAEDPEAFLRQACGDDGIPADIDYLRILSTVIISRKYCHTIPLFERLLEMMTRGYIFDEDQDVLAPKYCPWEWPLIGILNMVTVIDSRNVPGPEDASILNRLWDARQQMLDVIKRDLAKLLPDGMHADHLRLSVAKLWMHLSKHWPAE